MKREAGNSRHKEIAKEGMNPEGCPKIARSFMAGKEKFHLPLVFGGGKGSVIFLIQFLNIVCQRISGVRIMINLEQKSR